MNCNVEIIFELKFTMKYISCVHTIRHNIRHDVLSKYLLMFLFSNQRYKAKNVITQRLVCIRLIKHSMQPTSAGSRSQYGWSDDVSIFQENEFILLLDSSTGSFQAQVLA